MVSLFSCWLSRAFLMCCSRSKFCTKSSLLLYRSLAVFRFYRGSEFFHPGSRVKRIPDLHQIIWVFLIQKIALKLSKIWSGMFIPDPGRGFYSIPDPGVRKAQDPGSGSVTLIASKNLFLHDDLNNVFRCFLALCCFFTFFPPSNTKLHIRSLKPAWKIPSPLWIWEEMPS